MKKNSKLETYFNLFHKLSTYFWVLVLLVAVVVGLWQLSGAAYSVLASDYGPYVGAGLAYVCFGFGNLKLAQRAYGRTTLAISRSSTVTTVVGVCLTVVFWVLHLHAWALTFMLVTLVWSVGMIELQRKHMGIGP